MQIQLEAVGKRFLKEWIFRKINYTFQSGNSYAIVGKNGSGKSTLLQLIAGISLPSEGLISYSISGNNYNSEKIPLLSSYSAPYQELPEELTGEELFDFHFKFRRKALEFDVSEFFNLIQLKKQENKQIKYFSSGMKQRLRLGLCLFTDSQLYFFDEPTTNLDKTGIEWYHATMKERVLHKTIFISSNIEEEYSFCDTVIQIEDFK